MSESERKDSKLDVEDEQPKRDQDLGKETHEHSVSRDFGQSEKTDADAKEGSADSRRDEQQEIDAEGDSEAETLIQSPEKKRNSLAENPTVVHQIKLAGSDTGSIVLVNTSDKENATRKRKRSQGSVGDSPSRISSHRSSPLSSPLAHVQSDSESNGSVESVMKSPPRRRGQSDTEDKIQSPKKRRRRPSDIAPPPTSQKRSKRNSIDLVERRETRSATYPRPSDDERSPSLEPVSRREHRRGASTQLTTDELGKRKRGRPPAIHTKRNHSVDRASNSSDESEPRTNRARPPLYKLASTEHDTMSPAKVGPRKWKDKVGRTPLARACNDGDLEIVRSRYAERPEDLHEQDNAKNTPLQIASIEGWEEVVEFLLSKGAEVNVKNVDGDSPLIDAVENGHVPVIILLLQNGANARLANTKGYEPSELAKKDDDNYQEIRELLTEAKEKTLKKANAVDMYDYHNRDGASSRAASAASPRDSPPIGTRSPPAFSSRRRTGRSESTRNDLLYQANTQENLIKLAGKGDVQGVANILSILEKAETESLIAAAKAGHEEVLQLLIAMGKPNPDPDPVRGGKTIPGYNTPMLAAIGRGHPDVVKLLANQSGFNPTRKYKDRTYFELAEERHGDRWEEEVQILKQACDRYRGKKSSSPRKTRDIEKTKSRPGRRSSSANSTTMRMPSPTTTQKGLFSKPKDAVHSDRRKVSDPMSDKRRSSANSDAPETSIAVTSDIDQTAHAQIKTHRTRRSQSDLPPLSALSQEPAQRRRRLVTGKEHRSRQTISTSSDNEESDMIEVKQEDRSQPALKRSRVNSTPEALDDSSERAALKKRRTVLESSPEDARSRAAVSTGAMLPTLETALVPPEDAENADSDKLQDLQQLVVLEPVSEMTQPAVKRESRTSIVSAPITGHDEPPDTDVLQSASEPAHPEEEDDDPYSPPPAVEPPIRPDPDEEDRKARELAERLALEVVAQQEEERKEQERRAREQVAEEERRRQAAEEQRKKEEELQRREEAEREERHRQEMETRKHQEKLERERKRQEALPIVLAKTAQMIDEGNTAVKERKWMRKFTPLFAVKTRQLDPHCGTALAEEQWVPSFQVAGLLSTKDLSLLSYTSLERRPATEWQRHCMWRVARGKLSYDISPVWTTTTEQQLEMEGVAEEKFKAISELFWVKLSDFLDQVSRYPHLSNGSVSLRPQAITLKSYNEIFNQSTTPNKQHSSLTNGVSAATYINGENGVS